MYKNIFTILFCFCLCVHASAQGKSIAEEGRMYDDREKSVQTLDEVIVGDDSERDTEDETDYVKKYKNFGKEVQGDTTINFNEFELSTDSINAWKNNKNYAWIKTLENDLKNNAKEEQKVKDKINDKNDRIRKDKDGDDSETTTRGRDRLISSGGSNLFNSGILKVILWTLAGLFICFLVYNLFLSNGKIGKVKKETSVAEIEEVVDENNMDNDFTNLQKKAYNAGDTRLAMRYMFLKMLQTLQQKNHIQFVADKTNAAYAAEIKDGFRNEFSSLAMYFEYVWYGKLDIEKDVFDKIENKYNNFLNRI